MSGLLVDEKENKNAAKKPVNSTVCFLSALCMFLSAVEMAIPKPLPFLRIGLANLPLLIGLRILNPLEFFFLVLMKVIVQAIISGTLLSYIFIYSICGTFASCIIMFALYKWLWNNKTAHIYITNIGLCIAGSFANNCAQLGLSYFFMFGENTRYICALMLAFGFASGAILGVFTNLFEDKSNWFKLLISEKNIDYIVKQSVFCETETVNQSEKITTDEKSDECCETKYNKSAYKIPWKRIWTFVLFSLYYGLLIWLKDPLYKWMMTALLVIITLCIKKKVRLLPSIIVTASVVFMALLTPNGKVLFSISAWNITLGAVKQGLCRSANLVGTVFISKLIVDGKHALPGRFFRYIENTITIFQRLTSEKIKIEKGHLIQALDSRLCSLCFAD